MTETELSVCDRVSGGPLQFFWWLVTRLNKDESSTLHRFAVSRHVADLRWIVLFCLVLALSAGAIALWAIWHLMPMEKSIAASSACVAALLGVLGAVVAWSYQTAAVRLGVVDLFACEIGTLCRVGAVIDVAKGMIAQAHQLERHDAVAERNASHGFTSEEEYFPVFTSNARDLQILEADVVVNITAFYTYMKAMRDTFRKLAVLPPQAPGERANPRYEVMRSAIYMLFLAFESARKAIDDLIEFEPLRAECQIAILLTEVEAFQFLLEKQPKDFRRVRLELREPDYARLVRKVCAKVKTEARKHIDPTRHSRAACIQEQKRHQAWVMAESPADELRDRWARIEPVVKAA